MRRLWLLLFILTAGSCAPRVYDDPLAVMTNRQADPADRQAAAKQAQRQMERDPGRIAALNTLVWDRGYPLEQRRYAIDELIRIDEAQFRHDLARRMVLIENPDVLDYIYKTIVERKWTEQTATLVRQYARPEHGVTDQDRAERATLEKLNPGKSIERIVFDVFADTNNTVAIPQQAAAWELLNRLATKERLIALLNGAPSTTPLVIDLKACAAELHTVPVNREGVLWLSYIRDPKRRGFWDAAKARVALLTPEQRDGLELRHLPMLIHAPPPELSVTREQLTSDVRGLLAGAEHHFRSPTWDGQDKDYPQRFEEWADKLCWADLFVIKRLTVAVQDRGVAAALFAQADADKEDTSTEYGGALVFAGPGDELIARLYKPDIREHDRKFLSPQRLIESLYTAAAHHHFHAQEFHNSDYAGPGRGDLEFANHLRFNCLVFTFIDHDRLNADYYQHDGVVVDLGTISR